MESCVRKSAKSVTVSQLHVLGTVPKKKCVKEFNGMQSSSVSYTGPNNILHKKVFLVSKIGVNVGFWGCLWQGCRAGWAWVAGGGSRSPVFMRAVEARKKVSVPYIQKKWRGVEIFQKVGARCHSKKNENRTPCIFFECRVQLWLYIIFLLVKNI